jgi:adenylate cyclase, class 2
MIEAELKARVHNSVRLREALEDKAKSQEAAIYHDTYYDYPSHEILEKNRELRVRTVEKRGISTTILTFKDSEVDEGTQSKPEYEVTLDDPGTIDLILQKLNLKPFIQFDKHCINFSLVEYDQAMTATLVQVPELKEVFLEVETMVGDEKEVPAALAKIRTLLGDIGVGPDELTIERYTDMVAQARGQKPST